MRFVLISRLLGGIYEKHRRAAGVVKSRGFCTGMPLVRVMCQVAYRYAKKDVRFRARPS